MKLRFAGAVVTLVFALGALSSATTLKGVARNLTTGKPAAGDEVVVLSLANGMTEIGRGQTDSRGGFSMGIPVTQAPLLVRVIHQGVTYNKMMEPGASSIEIQVYEVASKLDGVAAAAEVQRFQAQDGTLQVIDHIAVRNASSPPRTLMNDRCFEVQLPAEAEIDSAMAQGPGGQPLAQKLTPGESKGQYYFSYPLRPGETRLQVVYSLPYSGQAAIEPKIAYPLERFLVVLPRSMRFQAITTGMFNPSSSKTGDTVQTTTGVRPGQSVAFRLSGSGMLGEIRERQQQAQADESKRPGGGMGPPIESPDPLHNHRWSILAALAMALVAGTYYGIRRPAVRRVVKREVRCGQQVIPGGRSKPYVPVKKERQRVSVGLK